MYVRTGRARTGIRKRITKPSQKFHFRPTIFGPSLPPHRGDRRSVRASAIEVCAGHEERSSRAIERLSDRAIERRKDEGCQLHSDVKLADQATALSFRRSWPERRSRQASAYAWTLSHARRLHSQHATARDRTVMEHEPAHSIAALRTCWFDARKQRQIRSDHSAPGVATHRVDRRPPRWDTSGWVLHSDPQSESLALPAGHAADHSPATPRATHTRRNR